MFSSTIRCTHYTFTEFESNYLALLRVNVFSSFLSINPRANPRPGVIPRGSRHPPNSLMRRVISSRVSARPPLASRRSWCNLTIWSTTAWATPDKLDSSLKETSFLHDVYNKCNLTRVKISIRKTLPEVVSAELSYLWVRILTTRCFIYSVPQRLCIEEEEGKVLNRNPTMDFRFRYHRFISTGGKQGRLLVSSLYRIVSQTSRIGTFLTWNFFL